jgi:hypothetical protein
MKLFATVIYKCLELAGVFVPGRSFQPSLWERQGVFPDSHVGSGLTDKHYTRLVKLARDKHSSLL